MAFSQLQERPPLAPGRTSSQQAPSSSYQVRGGPGMWVEAVLSLEPPLQMPHGRIFQCGQSSGQGSLEFEISLILFLAELDHQRGSAGPGVRRRCPGESLINPGFKRYLLLVPPSPPFLFLYALHTLVF